MSRSDPYVLLATHNLRSSCGSLIETVSSANLRINMTFTRTACQGLLFDPPDMPDRADAALSELLSNTLALPLPTIDANLVAKQVKHTRAASPANAGP